MRMLVTLLLLFAVPAHAAVSPKPGSFHHCSDKGSPPQAANALKNRSAPVPEPGVTTIAEIVALPITGRQIATTQAQGVQVEGYLLQMRQEGKESCNCGQLELHDFHLWIADSPTAAKGERIVVEITPRWRAANKGWTRAVVQALANAKAKVRVTGWPFLDPNHQDQVGKTRATRWEVHPITKLEAYDGGQWREL